MAASGDGRLIFGISGGGIKHVVADKLGAAPIYSATNRNALLPDSEINSNSCCWITTAGCGSEPINGGSSMYITAGQTYLGSPTSSEAISAAACLRIVKVTFGSPARRDSIGFEISLSVRFLPNKVCRATMLPP
jgi:hypothetical protein